MSPTKSAATSAKKSAAASAKARLTADQAMKELEKAGSAQTRKTWARHGAPEPMFGVSFATLKTLVKKIGVDQELALALWDSKNFDARMLAVKVADPAGTTPAVLDRWAAEMTMRMGCGYVAALAAEGPHGASRTKEWLAKGSARRAAGWTLLGHRASLDAGADDAEFTARLAEIEKTIATAPNAEREAMNAAVIQIGCRNAALKKAALAAAKRIGEVAIDHGDTACETPDAAERIEKAWAHSKSKGFASPAEQERAREPMRTRC